MKYIIGMVVAILLLALYDLLQKKHTILRNFPVIGHMRYILERFGPEIRQYLVAGNREQFPFNRREMSWVYAASKKQNKYYGFGTDADMNHPGHVIIKQAMLAITRSIALGKLYTKKVMGPNRRRPYSPMVVGISGMSYGALSAQAVSALNQGAKMVGAYQNTGEGGFSEFHDFGADVVFQIGTAYNGVHVDGKFSMEKLVALTTAKPCIRAIEIKLSQGAKPLLGGILPGAKVSKTIAAARDIPVGKDAVSPSKHSEFADVRGLVDFIERIAEATGLPVGIKSAVGQLDEWQELFEIMRATNKGPDFITIDGGEGGTGAAPPSFADHVSLPFNEAFTSVYKIFEPIRSRIVFIGSGKLGLPANAIRAFSMGVDVINIGREALLSLGCIQAQRCHTNKCPTGVATQDKRLSAGLDVTLKSVRCANYLKAFLEEVHEITNVCGYQHPSQISNTDVMLATSDARRYKTVKELFFDSQ